MLNTSLIEYLVHFNGSRDYFLCHDILEDCWKASPRIKKDSLEVGLIQVAVGQYHMRIGNIRGGFKMLNNALEIVEDNLMKISSLGIDSEKLAKEIRLCIKQENFKEINISIINECLLKIVLYECLQRNYVWEDNAVSDEKIIFKHRNRNRSEVVNARLESLNKKKKGTSD